jgi:hypothetical protein
VRAWGSCGTFVEILEEQLAMLGDALKVALELGLAKIEQDADPWKISIRTPAA